jgi:pilus assembly protein CpaB
MNVKTWIPLIVAVVLGLVAAKLGRDMMSMRPVVTGESGKFVPIVTAADDIAPGRELTVDDLAMGKISAENGAVGFANANDLVGRVVMTDLVQGQPIFDGALAPVGSGSGLQALIPEGMRAVTVEVNEFSGVAGLLVPGCVVDVIATLGSGDETMTRTIVENVRVTAVGRRTSAAAPKDDDDKNGAGEMFRSVTLLTTPQDAETIGLASATGRPRLVLRSSKDDEPAGTAGITLAELLGHSSNNGGKSGNDPFQQVIEPPVAPQAPTTTPVMPVADATPTPREPVDRERVQRRTVTIIRAGVSSDVVFDIRLRPMRTGNDIESATN